MPAPSAAVEPPNRRLQTLMIAQGVSAGGDTMTLTVLTVLAQANGQGTLHVMLILVASLVPGILLGPKLSFLLSKYTPGTVLKFGLVARAALIFALMLIPSFAPALALFFAATLVSVLETPAILALASANKPADLPGSKLFGRISLARNLGTIAGPLTAGMLIGLGTPWLAFAIDATTSIALATAVHLTRITSKTKPDDRDSSPARAWQSVADLIRGGGPAVSALWMLALAILFTASLPVAQVAFLIGELRFDPGLYGIVISCYAAGRLLASLLGSAVEYPWSQKTLLASAGIVMGISLAGASLTTIPALIFLAFFAAGMANTQQVLSIRTIIHDNVPEERIGTAFTALGAINNSATLIGVVLGGSLISILGGKNGLLLAGLCTLAATFVIVLLTQKTRIPPRTARRTR